MLILLFEQQELGFRIVIRRWRSPKRTTTNDDDCDDPSSSFIFHKLRRHSIKIPRCEAQIVSASYFLEWNKSYKRIRSVLFCISPESIKCRLLKCMCQRAPRNKLYTHSYHSFPVAMASVSLSHCLIFWKIQSSFLSFPCSLALSIVSTVVGFAFQFTWGFIRWQTYDIFWRKK